MCVICKTFRLCSSFHEHLMKLTQEDVDKLVRRVVDYGLRTAFVSEQFGVTQRRVQQLVKRYREIGKPPVLKRPGRKPCSRYSENLRDEVLWAKAKLKCSATGSSGQNRALQVSVEDGREELR